MKNLVLFLTITFLAFACSSPYKDKITDIDGWIVEVSEKKARLEALDTTQVMEISKEYAKNIAVLRSKLESHVFDTIDQKMAMLINNWKGIKKGSGKFIVTYTSVKRECGYTLKQLEDLRGVLSQQKMKGETLNPEDAERFYNDEKAAVKTLLTQADETIGLFESILAVHDSLTPKIKEYINRL